MPTDRPTTTHVHTCTACHGEGTHPRGVPGSARVEWVRCEVCKGRGSARFEYTEAS